MKSFEMHLEKLSAKKILVEAPAKINLFLEVLNRREDGFHNINSLFQTISLSDKLEFAIQDEPEISITISNNNDLTTGTDNLIARTYYYMKEKYKIKWGLRVILEKNIPVAAGLGGGSSDAASTIKACNALFGLNLTYGELLETALQIGSDLPFFFSEGQVMVSGRGEILQKTQFPVDYYLVLVNPGIPISTPESYAALKRGLTIYKNPFNLAPCWTFEEFVKALQQTGNDFEKVHLKSCPELERIKDGLLRSGAKLARMSGSGPTIFGIFKDKPDVNLITLERDDWFKCVVKPIVLRGII